MLFSFIKNINGGVLSLIYFLYIFEKNKTDFVIFLKSLLEYFVSNLI